LVNFGIHVELAWDKNLELTADVAGYLRRGLSEGIYYDNELLKPGIGGTTLWLTGNIGGLMTSGPNDAIYDPFLEKTITEAGHSKARAFGYSLANSVIDTFNENNFVKRIEIGCLFKTIISSCSDVFHSCPFLSNQMFSSEFGRCECRCAPFR